MARVFHAAAYTFAIPWARTISFSAGRAAQLTVGLQLLGVIA